MSDRYPADTKHHMNIGRTSVPAVSLSGIQSVRLIICVWWKWFLLMPGWECPAASSRRECFTFCLDTTRAYRFWCEINNTQTKWNMTGHDDRLGLYTVTMHTPDVHCYNSRCSTETRIVEDIGQYHTVLEINILRHRSEGWFYLIYMCLYKLTLSVRPEKHRLWLSDRRESPGLSYLRQPC